MGWNSSWIGGRLFGFIFLYCQQNSVGELAPADASYQCFLDAPGKVRRPAVSFIRRERLPKAEDRQGHCPVAPDLAAEVVSPNDLYENVESKVKEYLTAGVQLVWVINPATRTVRVHRTDGTVADLGESDSLDGEAILPGFECRVGELFRDAADSEGNAGEARA